MNSFLAQIFKFGVNDGDVIIKCRDDKQFRAHSFVLKYHSKLFKSMYESINNEPIFNDSCNIKNNTFEWSLVEYDYDTVYKIVNLMYDAKFDYNMLHNIESFYNCIGYIMPTKYYNGIVDTYMEKDIEYTKSIYHNRNINLTILILLAKLGDTNNIYINKIRDHIYKYYQTKMQSIYFVYDLYINNNELFKIKYELYMESKFYSDLNSITAEIINGIKKTIYHNM